MSQSELTRSHARSPFYTVMEAIVGLGPVPQPRPMSEGTTSHIRSSFSQRRPLEALSSAAQETVEGESRAMNAKTLIPECGPSRDSEVAHGTTISDISLHGRGSLRELVVRVAFKCAVAISLVAVAILWPDFERVVGLLGSLGAISVCIIVPLLAEMGMRWKDMSHGARCGIVVLLVISICELSTFSRVHHKGLTENTVMAVSGTFVALIPKTNSEK